MNDNDPLSYAFRNRLLKYLGFHSYQEYLKSDTWKCIKQLVFQKKGRDCSLCGGRSTEVHHHIYSEKILVGSSLGALWPLCRRCHETVEFTKGKKNDLRQAREIFRKMMAEYCAATGKHDVFSEEAQEMARAQAAKRCKGMGCKLRPRFSSDLCRPCEKKASECRLKLATEANADG